MKSAVILSLLLVGYASAYDCTGCAIPSVGVCKDPTYSVCYALQESTGNCPAGTSACTPGEKHYACGENQQCTENSEGQFTTMAECDEACQIECQSCKGESKGPCKDLNTTVCYEYQGDKCPQGSEKCDDSITYYSCNNSTCEIDTDGKFTSATSCETACNIQCSGCDAGSVGQCKSDQNVCYHYSQNECPQGSSQCDAGVKKYSCVNETCLEDPTGTFADMGICTTNCSIQCSGCNGGSVGQCKSAEYGVCYYYQNNLCPAGSTQCPQQTETKYSCVGGVCKESLTGTFSQSECQTQCSSSSVQCKDCWTDSKGPCKHNGATVCYELDETTGNCPAGSSPCTREDYFLN